MSQTWMFSQSSCLAAGTRCCCPRLALRLTVTVPLGKGLACPRFACALRAPFTDLQGYNSLGQFCLSAIVLQSLTLCRVVASPGAPGPHSQLRWSCPRPETMDACLLSICVAQSDFLPNKGHLALSLLSVSASSQKSRAALMGKGGRSGQCKWVLGRADKGCSDPACACPDQAVPWCTGTLPSLCTKALGFPSVQEPPLVRLHHRGGAFHLILTEAPRQLMRAL